MQQIMYHAINILVIVYWLWLSFLMNRTRKNYEQKSDLIDEMMWGIESIVDERAKELLIEKGYSEFIDELKK